MYLPPVYRHAFINNMFVRHGCDKETRELLEKLSHKELRILAKYEDLLERVKNIAKMSDMHLDHLMSTEYGFKVDSWSGGDYLLSVSELDNRAPGWWKSQHVGWAFELGNKKQFCDWAKGFLIQEVRINIWMRYIEYRKSVLKSKRGAEIDPDDILAAVVPGHFGLFL